MDNSPLKTKFSAKNSDSKTFLFKILDKFLDYFFQKISEKL
jgi:hypothetical protein